MAMPQSSEQHKELQVPVAPVTLMPAAQGSEPATPIDVALNLGGSDRNKLQAAFDSFNLMSQQLTEAYQALELQVQELTEELARTEARRENEVAEKQRVTGRLEGLLSALPVGVVVLDVRGRVQECNPAAIELLGEPLEGERWLDVIQRVFAPRLDDGHEVSLKDGRRVSIATRSLAGEPGQLIVLTDMTETRALQERLSRHQRLSALGKVAASLAHQIRTPLSAAMLYGEHLQNSELAPAQQKRFAGKLMSRLNHLEQQVRDMLIFARGDMPVSDLVTTDVLVQGLEAAMESPLEASQSRYQLDNRAPGLLLQCNKEGLIGAILNLVNNAIEVVGSGAEISVELSVVDANQLRICVADQGPGIAEDILAEVKEAFFTTKSHGTGLGLSVVQGVARAHHGEFFIESMPGQGTRMTLQLPLKTLPDEQE
ncbi:MAG: ATP-binding protein [Pseudomonadales bacterium]